jgi:aldehyde dehydrogenase (NAD+)
MTDSELDQLFLKQKEASRLLRVAKLSDRQSKLRKLRKWVMDHRLDFHEGISADLGKSPEEVDLTEIYPVITEAKHAVSRLPNWAAPKRVHGGLVFLGTRSFIQYEPLGTALIISPWNYPILLSLGPLVSAVAAGNTVILKPSEFTPATNSVIRKMIEELFQEYEVCLVEGASDIAQELLTKPFDHIFFTGSPEIGKIVMTAAAKHLTSVTLELGGKSPTIVDGKANIKEAAHRIAWGKWVNAGQTCVAPDYVFVHGSKAKEFKKVLEEEAQKQYENRKSYTSIINDRHFDRVSSLYDNALEQGANLVFGGDFDKAQKSIGPTVLDNISQKMDIMNQEIFGPLLPILTYKNIEEVIEYINARPKPLALYYYGRNKKDRKLINQQTSSGSLVFNDSVLQFGHPHLPMGGVNNSGIGKAHGHAGFLAFSHAKSVMKQKHGITILSFVYPPYTGFKKTIIKWMLKLF